MFSALGSSPRVRLGPITNTQGLPPNRLPILASQGPSMHAPLRNVLRVEVSCEATWRTTFTALVGVDWSDKKHDFCLLGVGWQQREAGVVAHRPEAIDQWARALYQRFG